MTLTVALALTACSAAHARTGADAGAKNGTIAGTVYGSGGPPVLSKNGTPRPAANHAPMKKITVVAVQVLSGTKFQTSTAGNGTFALRVPPGSYVLEAICGKANPPVVHVLPDANAHRNIECQFV